MRVDARGAAPRRALAYLMAAGLCLGLALPAARAQDAAPAGNAAIRTTGEPVLLRDQPGYDATVLATLSDGSALTVTGAPTTASDGSSWLPVDIGGQRGFVPAGHVDAAPREMAPAPAATDLPAGASGAATTTTEANLRSGPTTDAAILAVLPAGAVVSVDGAASNGFVPVTNDGVSGWVAAELLAGGAAAGTVPGAVPAPDPTADAAAMSSPPLPAAPLATAATAPAPATVEAAAGESTGIVWPVTGGAWEVVQGYNNGTHTNRSGFAQYKYSLDWARADGDTAGQPVSAPVSGTVQWVDRGSGGLLIDAGNGYGVALFHLTLDGVTTGGRVERGQRIGAISGPGGDGYMSMAHFEIAAWRLNGRSHESVPFVGPNAIAGQEFPDTGGVNQYMGTQVTP